MRVLSLFDGMACGMIAMKLAEVDVEAYDAYEIDKYCVKTAMHNFPMIAEHGDVFAADFDRYRGVDFLIGGSPCTYWSIAQAKNRETVASGMGWELFSQYVRALHEAKPKYFIYENNKSMSKGIRDSINEAFGFEAVLINSALVSAQNRQRLYWVGKRNDDGTYSKVEVEQPKDRGILLKDVLDSGFALRDKDRAVLATCNRKTEKDYFIKAKGNMAAEPVCLRYERTEEAKQCRKAYEAHEISHGYNELRDLHPRPDGKSNTLTTVLKDNPIAEPVPLTEREMDYMVRDHQSRRWKFCNKPGEKRKSECITANISKGVPYNVVADPVQIGRMPREDGVVTDSKQYRVYSTDGKAVTQCGQGGGLGAKTGLYAVPYAIEFGTDGKPIKAIGNDGKEATVYEVVDGKITIKGKNYPIKLKDGFYIIRKLTVTECKRLQTVPDWYEFPVSNSQAYKMLGNGWTCEVIRHLIESCLTN